MSNLDQETTTATAEKTETSHKKRKTEKQLTKDNYEDEEDDRFGPSEPANDVVKADEDTLKQRKFVVKMFFLHT